MASMIVRISARQEPQLVPACSALPIAATVVQPRAAAAAISLAPTPKQEHTIAPRSTDPLLGRPATMESVCAPVLHGQLRDRPVARHGDRFGREEDSAGETVVLVTGEAMVAGSAS